MSNPGELLRNARRSAGLSQRALARRAGTTQSAVARLETGRSSPSVATLERLLNAADRRLVLDTAPTPVDRSLIRASLRRTPLERLRHHDASRRQLARLVAVARRVPS